MPVTDSPLRYPGGKSQLTPFIIELLRENNLFDGVYVEPFAGGCGIAWSLLLDNFMSEVWINDIDPAIHAFWFAVLKHTDALCEKIERTRISMREWARQREVYKSAAPKLFDLGFSTLFLNRTNRSGILNGGVIGGLKQRSEYSIGCRFNKDDLVRKIRRIGLYRDQVRLSKLDAGVFMSREAKRLPPKSLINIDPPYYRKGPELYCNFYSHEDHVALARTIGRLNRPWILTYDDTDEVRKIYARRKAAELSLVYTARTRRVGAELLYVSPGLVAPARAVA